VHLVSLDSSKPDIAAVANQVERDLEAAGVEVLHDDRDGLSPGVKFKDADLLGTPLRLTVGARGLKDGIVELRDRRTKEVLKVNPREVVDAVAAARARLAETLSTAQSR
jgi:prolyl-tRNA synthetase